MSNFSVTFTGPDNSISPSDLFSILRAVSAEQLPTKVEFGILWSNDQAGRGRYPSKLWIEGLADAILRSPADERSFALHICGREALSDFFDTKGEVSNIANAFPRLQLNLLRDADTASRVIRACQQRPLQSIITQSNPRNALLAHEVKDCPNHSILFDASGGRGRSPDVWPEAIPGVHCGFAGGLGAHNLTQELSRITAKANGAPFWVDMESRLRSEADRFELRQVWSCIAAIGSFHRTFFQA